MQISESIMIYNLLLLFLQLIPLANPFTFYYSSAVKCCWWLVCYPDKTVWCVWLKPGTLPYYGNKWYNTMNLSLTTLSLVSRSLFCLTHFGSHTNYMYITWPDWHLRMLKSRNSLRVTTMKIENVNETQSPIKYKQPIIDTTYILISKQM